MTYFTIKIDDDLSLALVEPNMTEELFALTEENREYLREWLPWVDKTLQASDTLDFIKRRQQDWVEEKALSTVILFNGQIVGAIGFLNLDRSKQYAEIGYWLAEKYQKQGIMSRSVKTLLEYGFNTLNLRRIVICAAEGNQKSRAVAEKMGFTLEGILRQDTFASDKWHNRCIYGLLKEEWEIQNKGLIE